MGLVAAGGLLRCPGGENGLWKPYHSRGIAGKKMAKKTDSEIVRKLNLLRCLGAFCPKKCAHRYKKGDSQAVRIPLGLVCQVGELFPGLLVLEVVLAFQQFFKADIRTENSLNILLFVFHWRGKQSGTACR